MRTSVAVMIIVLLAVGCFWAVEHVDCVRGVALAMDFNQATHACR